MSCRAWGPSTRRPSISGFGVRVGASERDLRTLGNAQLLERYDDRSESACSPLNASAHRHESDATPGVSEAQDTYLATRLTIGRDAKGVYVATVEEPDPAKDAMYLVDGLPITARYEHFSIAFTRMVTYVAGCSIKSHETDYDGVDITISSSIEYERFYGAELELQLKCTTQQRLLQNSSMTWPMKAKPYQKLTRKKKQYIPRYLGVLLLPEDPDDWLSVDERQLVSKSRMYWEAATTFEPMAADDERETVTVHLPRSNIFDGTQLLRIMQQIGDAEDEDR